MNTIYGLLSFPIPPKDSRLTPMLLVMLLMAMFPASVMTAAEQGPQDQQEQLTPEQELNTTAPATHATQQAPQELLNMAVHEPERFIGKNLILDDGVDAVTVGPVKSIRRRLQDQQLYLIVDARAYFNTAVDYAVAVSDVDRIEADTLVIPEAPGMHLRGLDYYPDDYADIEAAPEAPVSEDD
jgi:hypothetical protein